MLMWIWIALSASSSPCARSKRTRPTGERQRTPMLGSRKRVHEAARFGTTERVYRRALKEQLEAQSRQLEAEQVRYKLSDLRYTNGVASYLDLLDAQRSLFALEQSVVQVRLAQMQNQVSLYKVLGGGWTEPGAAATTTAQ